MYFHSRADAGKKLAEKLNSYKNQNTVVLALSPGAVIVGSQIAMKLHSHLMMLLAEHIYLPGEIDAIASLGSTGTFTYNNMFSAGEIEEMVMEYHEYIAEQRLMLMHQMNTLLSDEGVVSREQLRRKIVIVVSDGLANGFSLDIASEFLKTIAIKKIIAVTPVASVSAVDRMHLFGDRLVCLNVTENYVKTNHYYEDNTVPSMHGIFTLMRNIAVHWERPFSDASPKAEKPTEAIKKTAKNPLKDTAEKAVTNIQKVADALDSEKQDFGDTIQIQHETAK